ncbi:hypothetical protein OG474_43790 [Kribbella sp. NBC_01505]|uniref:hypothetical protein n=1 Tax=Kribbella sp. NBC_01505 TaxID=2903580 RepID=UPI0038647013
MGKKPQSSEDLDALWVQWEDLRDELSTWNFRLGPVGINARFGSLRLAKYFVGFHLVVAIIGALLIFLTEDAPRDLGMALIVGALFGLGAFIAQVWAAQVSREEWLREDQMRRKISELDTKIERALKAARRQDPDS